MGNSHLGRGGVDITSFWAEKGREKVPVIVAIMTEICFRHTWNYLITVDYIYCLLMHYSTILFFIVKYATMITKFQRSGYKFLKFFLAASFFQSMTH